jgi:AraC-like DNA-binding protein
MIKAGHLKAAMHDYSVVKIAEETPAQLLRRCWKKPLTSMNQSLVYGIEYSMSKGAEMSVDNRKQILISAPPFVNQKAAFQEVLDELGFSAQGHFTRFFKQHQGVTPSLYRQQVEKAPKLDS